MEGYDLGDEEVDVTVILDDASTDYEGSWISHRIAERSICARE